MNDVTVDRGSLAKAVGDLDPVWDFAVGVGAMKLPSVGGSQAESDLTDLKLGAALSDLNQNWTGKCQSLSEDIDTYSQNLTYYGDSVDGTDKDNAEGLKPEWLDDVPTEGRK